MSGEKTVKKDKISRRDMLKLVASGAASAALTATGVSTVVASTPGNDGEITLRFLSPALGAAFGEWLSGEGVEAFRAECPGISVEFIVSDWGAINEQLLAAFAAGDAPDMFEHGSSASGASWAATGQVLPLDAYFNALADDVREDYYQVALDTAFYEGEMFSLPRRVAPSALAYRADFFEEAGLDPDAPPQSWEDLRDMAIALTVRDGDQITRAGMRIPTSSWGGVQQGWFPFVYQNGASILNSEMTAAAFDSDAGIEAIQFYHDMLWEHAVDVLGGIPTTLNANAVVVGTAAMENVSTGILAGIDNNFPELRDSIRLIQPPGPVQAATLLAVDRAFITRPSNNPDPAWQFLQFLQRPENLLKRFELQGDIPPRKSFAEAEAVASDELMQGLLANIPIGHQWPPTPAWNEFRSFVPAMSDAVMATDGDISGIVTDFASQINAALED